MTTMQNLFCKLFASVRKRNHDGRLVKPEKSTPTISKFEFTIKYIDQKLSTYVLLLETDDIEDLMSHDICRKLTDKYLLAMVFVYFLRAHLKDCNYTRDNFFAALLLAVDMEEEDLAIREELFAWALDATKFSMEDILATKDNLWHAMDFRAAVSMKTCHDVMSVQSTLAIWRRQRPLRHAGAFRRPMWSPVPSEKSCSGCCLELAHDTMSLESSSSCSSHLQCECFCCSRVSNDEDASPDQSVPPFKKMAMDDSKNDEGYRRDTEE